MSNFETEWKQWHAEREGYYGDPLGWVSLTGLYWLTEDFETIADLDYTVAEQCCKLAKDTDRIKGQCGFHWWPKPKITN